MVGTEEQYLKRLYGPDDLHVQIKAMIWHVNDILVREGELRINKTFVERIMMAVTEVNGCRYCSYFHTQVALKEGLNRAEIDHLLSGCLEEAPEEEIPALYFAQHYADSGGLPSTHAIQCLQETYSIQKVKQIREYIRIIMIGNTWGNAFDAFLVRIHGKPVAGSSLGKELGVIFGPLWMIPAVMLKYVFNRSPSFSEVR